VIPCGYMRQSFTDTLVKWWFFDNFPMFDDSFSVVSIHCVARGLGANFLYNCPASRGGSLRQHGLLVGMRVTTEDRYFVLDGNSDKLYVRAPPKT